MVTFKFKLKVERTVGERWNFYRYGFYPNENKKNCVFKIEVCGLHLKAESFTSQNVLDDL